MRKYFITFLALLTVLAISCNNRPTQASNFVEADETKSEVVDNNTGQTALTIANTTSANNPVVVANGDKIILAWENNSKIQYMTSSDGGKDGTRSRVQNLTSSPSMVKNPHIFFKSDDSVVVVATIGVGTISQQHTETPIVNINGTFQDSGNGIYTIKASALWDTAGLRNQGATSGSPQGWSKLLLTNATYGTLTSGNIRTVAGAGRITNSTLTLPVKLSEMNGSQAFAIKVTSTDGNLWTLVGAISGAESGKDTKFKTDGSAALNGDVGKSFESAKGSGSTEYSITANGTISGGSSLTISGGNNISESSIAVLSDGTVVTFTKESGGLVFRRIPASN